MQLASVNTGTAETLRGKRPTLTGIVKRPHRSGVRITKLGLAGDTICDTRHHGGIDQAVYIYGRPDYDWWSSTLGRELGPGTFGENLTIAGLESADAHIGDRLEVGDVVLEVTSPRIPCATLGSRMGDSGFVKRFMAAERPGVYCRVIREGAVEAGDAVVWHGHQGERVSILALFRDFNRPDLDLKTIRRYLAVPLHYKDRAMFEKQLGAAMAASGPVAAD